MSLQNKERFVDRFVYLGVSLASSSLLSALMMAYKISGGDEFYEVNHLFAWFSFISMLVGLNLKNLIFKSSLDARIIKVIGIAILFRLIAVVLLSFYLIVELKFIALLALVIFFEVSCWLRLKTNNTTGALGAYFCLACLGLVSLYLDITGQGVAIVGHDCTCDSV